MSQPYQSSNSYNLDDEKVARAYAEEAANGAKIASFIRVLRSKKTLLRGISVAMYIVGQERRLVDPPSQVVAGVRTVTTQMDERCNAHVAALILFCPLHFRLNSVDSLTQDYFSRR